ncbi:hypothetical protein [Streptomyces asoensis]|uniref:Uncharacterized protein n=1 Tax=Streptomyces asoensis TaxID=249586 RepID=A0ABQ3S1P3_9ACTN|nr:hypothetical protein [Streptomyces asoensis]GGQ75008.1 hypothetical protein GCM10010496_43140 [Streptomyces asoensis]GHI62033.1 hypothetical protein Saso_36830 [Streptomyces asoensis]
MRALGLSELSHHTVWHELEGTEAEARAEMLRIIDTFGAAGTARGRRRQRRRVYRVSERSYFVRVEKGMSSNEAHFVLAELVADTHGDGLPDTAGDAPETP